MRVSRTWTTMADHDQQTRPLEPPAAAAAAAAAAPASVSGVEEGMNMDEIITNYLRRAASASSSSSSSSHQDLYFQQASCNPRNAVPLVPQIRRSLTTVLFCSVLQPSSIRGLATPFIPILCHSDRLFHGESCRRPDVVRAGRAWTPCAFIHHCSSDTDLLITTVISITVVVVVVVTRRRR